MLFTGMGSGRAWYQRLTMLGVVAKGVAAGLENAGIIPIGTTGAFNDVLNEIGNLLIVTGIYRQVAKQTEEPVTQPVVVEQPK